MARPDPQGLTHITYMIAEIEAELDRLEARSEAVQALRQLDEREARGEPLTAVCGTSLRASLQRTIAASPVGQARRTLAELRALLDGSNAPAATAGATVIDLGAHRTQVATARAIADKPVWRRFQAAAVAAMLAYSALGLAQLSGFSRGPIIDMGAFVAQPTLWAALGTM